MLIYRFKICGTLALAIQSWGFLWAQLQAEELSTGTKNLIISISASTDSTIWFGATKSTFLKTEDFGKTFQLIKYGAVDTLQFRDIYGIDANSCVLLSAGLGSKSKIIYYSKKDGFKTVYQMQNPNGFLDAFEFWNNGTGICYGDAIDEKPFILITHNYGQTWKRLEITLPTALKGEGGFAASGTCVEVVENGKVWIGTGNAKHARLLFSKDYGNTWNAINVPIESGNFCGITSLRYFNNQLFITGGNLANDTTNQSNIYGLNIKNKSFDLINSPDLIGAYYCLSKSDFILLVNGPKGAAIQLNEQPWRVISELDLWVSEIVSDYVFLAGRDGRILRLKIDQK